MDGQLVNETLLCPIHNFLVAGKITGPVNDDEDVVSYFNEKLGKISLHPLITIMDPRMDLEHGLEMRLLKDGAANVTADVNAANPYNGH
ncbi:hypothetical protein DAPPUDRAFT_257749 [Daphnia pulex]|uniref:Uncharacterized protein n=1 Tax=Daphnia pulex TaxID=6669 RepID=E9HE51_DAPPU|nr:hypothetical protein DAPPUDRAFT_257749 [Daphnia pulex]|eukprot:EFX69950.1 hypothetical protein DAPPUDRAFT_257749 [Daphnia pulex]